jgi:hypothetical protein
MDNKPDNNPNANGEPKPTDELTPTPSYEQEPATGGQGNDSPFGPPISNVGSTSPGAKQDSQPIADVTPPTSSPNIKSGVTPTGLPVVNDTPADPVAISPDNSTQQETTDQPDFGGSMSNTESSKSPGSGPVGSPGVQSANPDATNQNSVEVDPVTAESVAPTGSGAFAAKKKRTGLWISLISVFVLLGLLVGGYFYLKSQADSVASDYTGEVKAYLIEVETAGDNIGTDPVGAAGQISELTRPTLGPAMTEFVSSEYSEAVELQKEVDAKVSAVLSKVVEVQNQLEVPDFVEQYEAKIIQLTNQRLAETDDEEFSEDYLANLLELQTLVADVALPETLDDSKEALTVAINQEVDLYTALSTEEATEEETTEGPTLEEVRQDQAEAFANIKAAEEAAIEAVDTLTQEAVAALEDLRTFRAGL